MAKRSILIASIFLFVFLSIISKNDWVDLFAFAGIMIAGLTNKESIVQGNADYGIYIYYTILVLGLVLFISKLYTLVYV